MAPDTPATDGPIDEPSAGLLHDRRIPAPLGDRFVALFGLDVRPDTLTAWADAARAAIDRERGRSLAVEDLCHADDGPHVARTDDATHRFVCVLDAFVLAGLADAPVAVESPDPETGERLDLRVSPDGRVEAPAGTVVSLGVAHEVPDGPPSTARTYGALCPYVHAFASRTSYEAWADDVDAETMPLSVAEAALAARVLAGAD